MFTYRWHSNFKCFHNNSFPMRDFNHIDFGITFWWGLKVFNRSPELIRILSGTEPVLSVFCAALSDFTRHFWLNYCFKNLFVTPLLNTCGINTRLLCALVFHSVSVLHNSWQEDWLPDDDWEILLKSACRFNLIMWKHDEDICI